MCNSNKWETVAKFSIGIGRPNGFFQCIIFQSNGIHRHTKKSYEIEIFAFDHILIVNTIYKDHYHKEYYTLDHEISIAYWTLQTA